MGLSAQFETSWQVSGDLSVTIPTNPSNQYSYNYSVDWGDGSTVSTNQMEDAEHTYTTAGTYTITISGDFPAIFFKNSDDREKITAVTNWGGLSFGWETFAFAFAGCSNLNSLPSGGPNLTNVTDLSYMFYKASSLNTSLNTWNVSTITTMRGTFSQATAFNGNISSWDVSAVTDMASLFEGANAFNQDLSSWGTKLSNVSSMSGTFSNTKSFNQDLSAWNVSAVKNFSHLFEGACAFDQDLGAWNMTAATDLTYMLSASNLSSCNYERTLKGWSNNGSSPTSVTLGADGLSYFTTMYRDDLINGAGKDWTIVGDDESREDNCILVCHVDEETYFKTTWTITDGSVDGRTINIPTHGTGYNYDVDWDGDGVFLPADIGYTGDASHVYTSTGIYNVSIRGTFPRIQFYQAPYAEKITSIDQWGCISWTSFDKAFWACTNLVYNVSDPDDVPDLSNVTTLREMFRAASSFTDLHNNGNFNNWNLSTITDIAGMFRDASSFNGDIGGWNVSNVTTMGSLFSGASMFNRDIGGWTTTSLTNLSGTFNNAAAFNNGLASGVGGTGMNSWDVDQVTTMYQTFTAAAAFNQDLSNWVVSSVTTMRFMFYNAVSFNNGRPIGELPSTTPLNWERTSAPTSTLASVNHMGSMFRNTPFNQDINDWNVSLVSNMSSMFYIATDFNQDISGWNVSAVTNMSNMFGYATDFDQPIGAWGSDVSAVTTMEGMFFTATNFNQALDNWILSALTNTRIMFRQASSFNNGLASGVSGTGINGWDVDGVTNMSSMFMMCTAFNQDISGWDPAAATNMSSMFMSAINFNQDISGWSVSGVQNMSSMFYGAGAFNQPLGNWERTVPTISSLSSVANMSRMFYNASAFNQDIGNWNLNNVQVGSGSYESMNSMLSNCGMGYTNYDATLQGWAYEPGVFPLTPRTSTPNGLTLGSLNLEYCTTPAVDARLILTGFKSWGITGDANTCITPITGPTTNKPALNSTTNLNLNLSPATNPSSKISKGSAASSSINKISVNSISNGNLVVKQTKPSRVSSTLSIEVFNLNGKLIYQAKQSVNNNSFNTGGLAKGTYIVKVKTNSTIDVQKVVIK